MTFKIETGIPLPKTRRATMRYPYEALSIGDSFFVPDGKMNTIRCDITRRHHLLKPMRFTASSATEDGVSGVRVWRTQ